MQQLGQAAGAAAGGGGVSSLGEELPDAEPVRHGRAAGAWAPNAAARVAEGKRGTRGAEIQKREREDINMKHLYLCSVFAF